MTLSDSPGLDKNSLILCGFTLLTKIFEHLLLAAPGFISNMATMLTMGACITTIIYNFIKIGKEIRGNKFNHPKSEE